MGLKKETLKKMFFKKKPTKKQNAEIIKTKKSDKQKSTELDNATVNNRVKIQGGKKNSVRLSQKNKINSQTKRKNWNQKGDVFKEPKKEDGDKPRRRAS